MDANPKRIKKDAFSKRSGYMWTGPNLMLLIEYIVLINSQKYGLMELFVIVQRQHSNAMELLITNFDVDCHVTKF